MSGKTVEGRSYATNDITQQESRLNSEMQMEATPGRVRTGLPTVDSQKCEREGDELRPGCFLTPTMRTRAQADYKSAVHVWMANNRAGLQRVVIAKRIHEKKSWWTMLAEMAFSGFSVGGGWVVRRGFELFQKKWASEDVLFSLIGERTTKKIADRFASVTGDQLVSGYVFAMKGVRTELKNAAHAGSDEGRRQADFLGMIEEQFAPAEIWMANKLPAILTDEELIAATHAMEDTKRIDDFAQEYESLCDRFVASGIDDVGVSRSMADTARVHVALVARRGGDARYARIEYYDENSTWTATSGKRVFRGWIEDDLVSTAQIFQEQRNLEKQKFIDWTDPETEMPEIEKYRRGDDA